MVVRGEFSRSKLQKPSQNFRQAFAERRARQHAVETRLRRALLQFDMYVREEAYELSPAQFVKGFQAARKGERVFALQVQIDDDERGRVLPARFAERLRASRKYDFDAGVLRRRANLRGEKEVVNDNDHASLHLISLSSNPVATGKL